MFFILLFAEHNIDRSEVWKSKNTPEILHPPELLNAESIHLLYHGLYDGILGRSFTDFVIDEIREFRVLGIPIPSPSPLLRTRCL